jgi:anti-sigma B factor antagonist
LTVHPPAKPARWSGGGIAEDRPRGSPLLNLYAGGVLVEGYQLLDVSAVDGLTIARLTVREIEETKIQDLAKEFSSLVEQVGAGTLVVDLGVVSFLTSSSIGVLIAMLKRIRAHGGQMKLCGLLPEIRELFTITQIDRVFEIHASVEDALPNATQRQTGSG